MRKNEIYYICITAILLALLIVSSKIVIPFPIIPMTLQTFVIILIPLLLKRRRSAVLFLIYISLGLMGLPVFSSGGGFSYIYIPSFGFIVGFFLQSLLTPNFKNKILMCVFCFLRLGVIYIVGSIYMCFLLSTKDIPYILSIAVFPFAVKDVISALLAFLVYERISPFLKNEKTMDLFVDRNEEKILH